MRHATLFLASWVPLWVALTPYGCGWEICEKGCADGDQCISGTCVDSGGNPVPDTSGGTKGTSGFDGSSGTHGSSGAGGSTLEDAGDVEPTCSISCPSDMVRVTGTCACIDKYEASLEGGIAHSRVGVVPSVAVTFKEAADACRAAGKRLCTKDEWLRACAGSNKCTCDPLRPSCDCYPFGRGFRDVCVGPRESVTDSPPDAPQPAGSYARCEGGVSGLYDMAGNVREWLDETECDRTGSPSCATIGGSYTSSDFQELTCGGIFAIDSESIGLCNDPNRFECSVELFRRTGTDIGFRCCR